MKLLLTLLVGTVNNFVVCNKTVFVLNTVEPQSYANNCNCHDNKSAIIVILPEKYSVSITSIFKITAAQEYCKMWQCSTGLKSSRATWQ